MIAVGLGDIAARCGLQVHRDGSFSGLGYLNGAGERLLVPLHDAAFLPVLEAKADAAAVITTPALAEAIPGRLAVAIAANPLEALFRVHETVAGMDGFYRVDSPTRIAASAKIHPRAHVDERNVVIGEGCVIGPNATVLEGSVLGRDVVVWAGCTIGADGFEARFREGGRLDVIPHTGGVMLHDRVHVQANSVIDRSLFGQFTEIGEETKIGSLVNIAHNVRVGRQCRIIDTVMIAGSAVIGDRCWLAPGAMIGAGVRIGDGSVVGAQSFVKDDLPEGSRAWGCPAAPR